MTSLHLVVAGKLFDRMLTQPGRWRMVQRRITPYWQRLLWKRRYFLTHCRITCGCSSRSILRTLRFVCRDIDPLEDTGRFRYYHVWLGRIVAVQTGKTKRQMRKGAGHA